MITPVVGAALVALVALALYLVLGGADFGGGVWDLFASGPRRNAQRDTISNAIGPVWEANHVWLIFGIVTLFTCFPPAFADVATNLNAPLTLPAGEYWFGHDASIRTAPAVSSTAKSVREDELGALISSQKVDGRSFRLNLFGREMFLDPSWTLPEAVVVRPSAPVQPR